MRKGEKIYRLIASKDFSCDECQGTICAGRPFLLDKIPYPGGVLSHKIHEGHWLGSPRDIIDLTRKKSRLKPIPRRNY